MRLTLGLGILVLFFSQLMFFTGACQSSSDYSSSRTKREDSVLGNVLTEGRDSLDEPSPEEKLARWKDGFAFVTKVIDGDTFWVDNGEEKFKVRFIGVDAPETRNSRYKKKGYYAQEAKSYVASLTDRKWVRLVQDVQSHDRYQRLLAYVYLEDGTFLNAELVANGYAVVATFPPNVQHVDELIQLQKEAREGALGLWGVTSE